MYAVVSRYSFDNVQVDLFGTYDAARDWLVGTAENKYKVAIQENGWDATLEFNKDGSVARLTEHIGDGVNVTDFEIATIVSDHTR